MEGESQHRASHKFTVDSQSEIKYPTNLTTELKASLSLDIPPIPELCLRCAVLRSMGGTLHLMLGLFQRVPFSAARPLSFLRSQAIFFFSFS